MGSKAVLGSVAAVVALTLAWLMLAPERGGSARARDPVAAEGAHPGLAESPRDVTGTAVERSSAPAPESPSRSARPAISGHR